MGNLGFKIKRFLQNKNTVTIIGVALIVGIIYFGYNYRIKQATNPTKVPYAKTTIQPRTKITEDMIGYMDVMPSMINKSTITNIKYIVGKWSNYNTIIPEGSLFYTQTVVTSDQLPDSAFITIPEGYTPFNLSVNAAIPTDETISTIITLAYTRAINVGVEGAIVTSETAEPIIGLAQAKMLAIASEVADTEGAIDDELADKLSNVAVAAAPVVEEVVEEEEEEEEEESSEEEAAAGLGALFG